MCRRPVRLFAIALALGLSAACSSTDHSSPACMEAGGTCLIGGQSCAGTIGTQACATELLPSGPYCCLPCAAGETAVDGGGCRPN